MPTDFIAYAGDCRITGTIALADSERLTDLLNRESNIAVRSAELISTVDGHVVRLDELALDLADIFAIEPLGSRGSSPRRIHTVRHRLQLKLGPYTVLGQLHTMPGGLPLAAIGRRPGLIPLTRATIAFNDYRGVQARDVDTLIVNRELAEWVRADSAELPAFAGVPLGLPPTV
jgi:hypothetical protein